MSIHPYWLLYLKSDCYYFLVYHVFRYRRKVVRNNLLNSFPDKDAKAIKAIERRFYRNLCDVFVEAPKMYRLKSDDFLKRVKPTNPEVITDLEARHVSFFYALPHSGNWEWFGKTMPELSAHNYKVIYKKVKDPVFERLMLEMREKNNVVEMLEANTALKHLVRTRDDMNAVLILADQSPRGVASDYWTEFLHQDTCWFGGLERMAKMLDYAVVFVALKRVGRGRYEATFELITDQPKATENGFIMASYVRCIERLIQEQPDNWLWSHRRWKHQRNQEAA